MGGSVQRAAGTSREDWRAAGKHQRSHRTRDRDVTGGARGAGPEKTKSEVPLHEGLDQKTRKNTDSSARGGSGRQNNMFLSVVSHRVSPNRIITHSRQMR